MTTLLQRCQSVAAKSQEFTLAQRHASQQRQVQERTREWKSCYEKLTDISARAAFLPLSAEALKSIDEKRVQLRHNAEQILLRLNTLEDIAELTADASWARLLSSVKALSEELEASVKLAWKSYIHEQGALDTPTWLREQAPYMPRNDAAITAYKEHYSVYAGLVKLTMPRTSKDLVQLSQIIATCRYEAARIEFDVPPDVQQFFKAIQSGSATLASLTSGVLEWLGENGQLERYLVRSIGQ